MSDGNSVQPHEVGVSRTLRERLVDIFRTSSQTSYPVLPENDSARVNEQPDNDHAVVYPIQEPDARTRLLESYHRREPICGLESCNHGTFSPRVGSRTPGYNGAYGPSGQSSARPGSAERSDITSSMERSTSELPVKNRTILYALPQ
ncbi:hypothetical protein PHISCL_06208 [Aspergillus sclerotialis]|uniref:Uncharacterized protein n=1 Tax=Aspergillus sclerotialis TaxID=2070753 RepID=A0A3A2ZQ21_9EURO|nr:hypothetical protein PHISCL_06208 [Aspergillus sclerotialis]